MSLDCEMVRSDPKTGEEVSTIAHFGSKNHKLIGTDDTEETQGIMREKILKSFSEYQRRGSGWRLRRVTQRNEYPKPGSTTKFENYERIQEFPITIYADFECYIRKLIAEERGPDKSSTTQYQKHNPSGF